MTTTKRGRGRPPREKGDPIDLPEYEASLTIEGQMAFLGNAAMQVAYDQLRSGKIAPSTLNKLLEFANPANELKNASLASKSELDKSKVQAIKATSEEKIGHIQVLEEIKGYRGNAFDERTANDIIGP